MEHKAVIVETTVDLENQAKTIADLLVAKKLAACVQILGPINSVYTWQGQLAKEEEWLIRAKTKSSLVEAIFEAISDNHDYDVPELIVLPVIDASAPYLKWLQDQTSASDVD